MQYVYLIKCNSQPEYYKVGIAIDVENRLAQLQTGSPFELTIEECYSFDNAEIVERAIHQAWKKVRVRGEWFDKIDVHDLFNQICSTLGGQIYAPESYEANDEEVESADEAFTGLDIAKFDYAAMFADGWRMAEGGRGARYWNWRRGASNEETIYGGVIKNLPHSIDEMRRIYRDGTLVIPTSEEK